MTDVAEWLNGSTLLPAGLGLGAALLWGTADFFAKGVAERDGSEAALLWLYLVGLPVYLILWAIAGAPTVTASAAAIWLLVGVLNASGYLFLYRGFQVGLLAVVSTTNAAWAAITVLLSAVFLGEVPRGVTAVGLLMTLTGVVLVAYPGGAWSMRAPGFKPGLASAILFGTSFFLLKLPQAQGDVLAQAVILRAVGLVLVGGVVLGVRRVPARSFARRPPLFAFLDSAGFLCFVTGLALGAAYIVAPMGSLLTPVAVGLAAIFLRERLKTHQWIGFAMVAAGALLLA